MHDLLAFLRNKHIPGVPVYPVNCPLSTMSVASPSCHYYDMDKELRKVKKPRLVVICGPSGCGKSSLVNRLMADLGKDTVGFSVSHTTREPRHDDEQEGVHFHFFSDEAFDRAIQNDEFVEHTEFCGHRYGTSKRAVLSVLETGKLCLLELNIQGFKTLKKLDLNPICIWIKAPSYKELTRRITERGTETDEELQERLEAAKKERTFGETPGLFDYVVLNDDIDKAYDELKQIVEKIAEDAAV